MSETDTDDLEQSQPNLPPEVYAQLRQGRKAARELEQARQAQAALERTIAIEKAGIPEHPARDLVFKDYDGPTDPESLKAHAEKFGIVSAPAAPTAPTEAEIAAQRQILSAGTGQSPTSGDVDLAVALRNAKSPDEVMQIVQQVQGTPGFRSQDGLIGVIETI